MNIRKIEEYQTSDKKRFNSLKEAQAHQTAIDLGDELIGQLCRDYDFEKLKPGDKAAVAIAIRGAVDHRFYEWMKDWMKRVYEAKRLYNPRYSDFPDLEE